MGIKDIISKTNGKKTPVALLVFIITASIGYGGVKQTVADNTKNIDSLKPIPAQVAQIDQKTTDIKEDFTDFRGEQRKVNDRTTDKLDRILEAVLE